ncbi:MAG: hypothetical protein WC680_06795 [Sulfuricurvum sp.]|jgi:hypothetical protein
MENIECEVFGDESTSDDRYGIYSLIGLYPSEVKVATLILEELKKEYNIPPTSKLHCRVLFSGDKRAKTEWKEFDGHKAIEFCKKLSSQLLSLNIFWSYGYVDLKELNHLPNPSKMEGKFSTDEGREFSFLFGVKQAQQFAYSAAEISFIKRFGTSTRFWCDKETTKIDWFFEKKQAQNIQKNLSNPPLTILPDAYIPMLEIADLFAYTASRNLSVKQRFGQHTFRTIHEKFHPMANKFNLDPSLFGSDINTMDWLNGK